MQSVSKSLPKILAAALVASVLGACGDSSGGGAASGSATVKEAASGTTKETMSAIEEAKPCLLYTSDAADE